MFESFLWVGGDPDECTRKDDICNVTDPVSQCPIPNLPDIIFSRANIEISANPEQKDLNICCLQISLNPWKTIYLFFSDLSRSFRGKPKRAV